MQALQAENARLKQEIAGLRRRLAAATANTCGVTASGSAAAALNDADAGRGARQNGASTAAFEWEGSGHSLSRGDIERYSRQLILPALGVQGQMRLKESSVLVVGAGGLGCPAILYLAAAGVGRLGIVDRDAVELSNIHRQVAHSEASVGLHKADSAAAAARAINSGIQVEAFQDGFAPANALALVSRHDVVIDASDNAATRYLASDACCVAGRPLVSGAALGTDGQLTVYHHGQDGPCYRCLFPVPPRADACSRCSDAGVLGPVPGAIGVLQALEAIKLVAGIGKPLAQRLLIMDALAGRFSTVQLRVKSTACAACGDSPTITAANLAAFDYEAFTGSAADDDAPCQRLLSSEQRVSAELLAAVLRGGGGTGSRGSKNVTFDGSGGSAVSSGGKDSMAVAANEQEQPQLPLLLDVRPTAQFDMCRLPGAINIPFEQLQSRLDEVKQLAAARANGDGRSAFEVAAVPPVVVLCRRGNDSQEAVQWLTAAGVLAVDLADGLNACGQLPHSAFPQY